MDRKPPLYADMPLPDLLRQLSSDTATLVRQEVGLARVELTQKAKEAGASAGMFGTAAVAGLGAFGAFTAFLVAVIALAIPMWASALTVAIGYVIVAALAALRGKKALDDMKTPLPEETVRTLGENVEAVRAGARRGR